MKNFEIILIIILVTIYLNERIISKRNNLKTNEIKISVIIPVYNGGKYLNYSLGSIQNQKMKDIEIIIIDDNSKDDSLKIARNYMKNDKRIKLIKNNENRRILFCKSIGALNSKGKYIIEIDQDDVLIKENALDIVYKESIKYKLDLLHFHYIFGNNILRIPKIKNYALIKNNVEKQPKIRFSIFSKIKIILWGNLIRSDLYKKVIYFLWPVIINYKLIFQEDFLIVFFLLMYAEKYKEIKNVLYFYFLNIKSISNNNKNNSEYYLSVIFVGIIFYDYYIDSNPRNIQIIINYINFLKEDFIQIKKLFPSLFNYFFGKILTNNQLILQNKKNIISDFNISENCDFYISLNKTQNFDYHDLLLNKEYFHLQKKKKILELSVIVICNNYRKIIKLINSILSQNYGYLEIILIFDDEDKKNYYLLQNYIKSYFEIKIIDNKIKKGFLFSISKAVMDSKQKYLLILNPNCFFLDTNFFQSLDEEIKKNESDIIEFNLIKIFGNNLISLYRCKHFESQFNLTNIKFNSDYNEIDIKSELLTNKLFKTNFLRKIITKFKLDKVNEIIDYYPDKIYDFAIESSIHEFRQVNSVSLYINDSDCDKPKFNNFSSLENKKVNETIFYINYIYDKSKNSYKDKEKVLKEFFNVLSIIFNKFTNVTKSSLNLLNKFLNCKYISKNNKNLLKFYYESLIN